MNESLIRRQRLVKQIDENMDDVGGIGNEEEVI